MVQILTFLLVLTNLFLQIIITTMPDTSYDRIENYRLLIHASIYPIPIFKDVIDRVKVMSFIVIFLWQFSV